MLGENNMLKKLHNREKSNLEKTKKISHPTTGAIKTIPNE